MALPALASVRRGLALLLLGSASMGPVLVAHEQPTRTVLAVHYGAEDFPVNPVIDAAIREALTSSHSSVPIDYFAEYLESDLLPVPDMSRALDEYIRSKYQSRRIDLVIATAHPALRFVLDHRRELFPDAPIVYSGVAIGEDLRTAGAGLTGVVRGVAYAETLKLALDLHPGTKRVFVVARGSDRQSVDSVRAELRDFSRAVSLTYLDEPTVPRLLAAVSAIHPPSVILYVWHWQEHSGNSLYADMVVHLVAEASHVPVYGTSDFYVGSGVIGGVIRGTGETGARVGEMALQILNGRRAQDIPIETARLVPTFDWRQVQRWGIDSTQLPQGSRTRFRTQTAWESYRWYIVATFIVVTAQLLLITALLTQRTIRRRAEETIRDREATLRASYRRIRQLAGRLINVQEEARSDMARDLHDDVCQELAGISMAVAAFKGSTGHIQDSHAQEALSKLHHGVVGILAEVRRLSHELHPVTLRLLGVASALKAHCIEVEKRHDVQVTFNVQGDLRRLHPEVQMCLFRIAQEALRNGAVHGDARRIDVSIVRSREHVELTVADDGTGFDVEAARQDGSGLGLVSMEERAHIVGGGVDLVARPGHGTTIRVRVPAPLHAPEAESPQNSARCV